MDLVNDNFTQPQSQSQPHTARWSGLRSGQVSSDFAYAEARLKEEQQCDHGSNSSGISRSNDTIRYDMMYKRIDSAIYAHIA